MSRLSKLYMGTNTKMYKTPVHAVRHLARLTELCSDIPPDVLQLFIIPSYTSIEGMAKLTTRDAIMVGAQSIGYEEEGQYTGEISPLMLSEVGADLVMVGHSERRHTFLESDFDEERRVRCAIEHDFTTLLCVGETLEQKQYGVSREALAVQLKIGLHSVTASQANDKLWIAYEPVWAIGVNGVPADESYANAMHGEIKAALSEIFGSEIGGDIPVLYGGSVNLQNAEKLIRQPNIDGLFIGRGAWDADNFNSIIRAVLPLFQERKGSVRSGKEW
ncbi:triosephosphate isomerase [Synergistales bacterium]|nr:triosephosphate isomerase [Synergistales bacterium]